MNSALCAFAMRWEIDGDYMRCLKCKRPQITNYASHDFPHAHDCKAAGKVEARPWETFAQLLSPLTRALSGEKAGPVGDGWQPIESAPKDGTRIMLSNGHGAWMAEYQPVFPSGYRPSSPWSSAMLNHEHMPLAGRHKAPTHWMPLPASPTPDKEG